jgi:hypothetical protein
MMKKRATKEDKDVPLDVRREIEAMYEALGGRPNFIKYGKRHETWAYNNFVRTMPTQVAASVDTHVTHCIEGDAARAKLETAFMNLIDAHAEDEANGIFRDKNGSIVARGTEEYRLLQEGYEIEQKLERLRSGIIDVEPERITDQSSDADRTTIDGGPSTRGVDEPSRADHARDARHGSRDDTPSSTVDDQSIKNENSNLESKGTPDHRGLREGTTVRARPVSAEPREPSSTDLYYKWMEGPGGARNRWGPI